MLAYIGATDSAPPAIWVRTLASSDAQPLRGTEGALRYVWSPDSKYIAFVTQAGIQKIAAAGGAPQVLVNQTGRDLAWSSQGVILIGGTGPLLRVPEAGGQAVPESELDKTLNEVRHDYPHFLPDGQHYFFLARSDANPALYVGKLGSKERHAVPGINTDTRYSTSGHVVFLREGMLMGQAFDPTAFSLSGMPFVIAAQAAPASAVTTNFSVSQTGSLAYLQTEDTSNTRLVWFSRSGKESNEEPVTGSFQAPNLSNDGKYVVFQRGFSPGKTDIWTLDLARGTDMRVTFNGDAARPVFSSDGTQVVYVRTGSGSEIYRKAASGTGAEERLVEGEPTDWSPDGRHILFIRDGDVWALALPDKKDTVVATGKGNDRRGRFSRDGKWMAYESDESGQFEVYVQNFPPNGNRWQVSANGGGSAWWSSDGKELFFYAPDGKLMSVNVKLGNTFEASPPQEMFKVPGVIANGRFVASLDAQRFLLPLQKEQRPFLAVVLNWVEGIRR
jgi:Tol biopolymer transport system component